MRQWRSSYRKTLLLNLTPLAKHLKQGKQKILTHKMKKAKRISTSMKSDRGAAETKQKQRTLLSFWGSSTSSKSCAALSSSSSSESKFEKASDSCRGATNVVCRSSHIGDLPTSSSHDRPNNSGSRKRRRTSDSSTAKHPTPFNPAPLGSCLMIDDKIAKPTEPRKFDKEPSIANPVHSSSPPSSKIPANAFQKPPPISSSSATMPETGNCSNSEKYSSTNHLGDNESQASNENVSVSEVKRNVSDNDGPDDEHGDSGYGSDHSSVKNEQNKDIKDSDVLDENSKDEEGYELSEYEKLRLRNIERNQRRLRELGLLSMNNTQLSGVSNKMPGNKRRKSKMSKPTVASTTSAASRPVRRSRRLVPSASSDVTSNDDNMSSNDVKGSTEDNCPAQEMEEQYEVSPLFQYTMNDSDNKNVRNHHTDGSTNNVLVSSSTSTGADAEINTGTTIGIRNDKEGINANFSLEPITMTSSSALTKSAPSSLVRATGGPGAIYSLQFLNEISGQCPSNRDPSSLLLGAGKGGIVSLWDCYDIGTSGNSEHDESDLGDLLPKISWKAHGGRWICDAQFMTTPSSSPSSLFVATAANDGTVCLWDMNQRSCKTHAPKLLFQSTKELHAKGIFSMDVLSTSNSNRMVATGSKDKTVAVSNILDCGKSSMLWRTTFHSSKVSAVQWQKSTSNGQHPLLASASDDGLIGIHDTRSSSASTPTMVISDAHDKPHSVVWEPASQYGLLTGKMIVQNLVAIAALFL